ncbi:MAG: hypothetical protein AAB685_03245 [Patescibacteria group bacterium]
MRKYISNAINTPLIKIRFKKFPSPKYLKIKNDVIPNEIINPLLEFERTNENKRYNPEITREKNKGKAPVVDGSMK